MYLQQAELLRGMDRKFIMEFLDIAMKESHKEGDFLFHSGEKARYFFILIKGHIRLSLGIFGHVVHIVGNTGEAFGWSSLVGRSVYREDSSIRHRLNALSRQRSSGLKMRRSRRSLTNTLPAELFSLDVLEEYWEIDCFRVMRQCPVHLRQKILSPSAQVKSWRQGQFEFLILHEEAFFF